MDIYSTEVLKLSPSADICVHVPLVVLKNSAYSDKSASKHLLCEWNYLLCILMCKFADTLSEVNKIDVELAKKRKSHH